MLSRITRLTPLITTCVVFWGTACSDSASGGTGQTGPVAESDFPAQFSRTVCQAMASCCQQNAFTYDFETCRASLDAQLRSLLTARGGMQVSFDDSSAGRCIEDYATTLSACEPRDVSACDQLFVGLVPLGGACTQSVECADEASTLAYCDDGICTPDTTAADTPRRGQAEPCNSTCTESDSGQGCSGFVASGSDAVGRCFTNDGLYCDSSTGTCMAAAQEGEPCAGGQWCVEGAFCDLGTCAAQRETGPCPDTDACAPTSYCDVDTAECTPKHAEGEPCTEYYQCLDGTCRDGVCRRRVPVDEGVCVGLLD